MAVALAGHRGLESMLGPEARAWKCCGWDRLGGVVEWVLGTIREEKIMLLIPHKTLCHWFLVRNSC